MKKSSFTVFAAILALSLTAIFVSCSDKIMGYGVVLWNIPEKQISAGEVIPVYIKSNISHVYVVGLSSDDKFEVPLWMLTSPLKKRKANEDAEKYREYAHIYASAKIDGLPIRNATVNTSKQVYRLRKGEVIKVLYKGTGQAVMAGQNALEGDWLRVLTDDGTQGWCFSYNLALFETDVSGARVGGEEIVEEEVTDAAIEKVISSTWYPAFFKDLIESGNIDISRLNASYKFKIDTENNKVSLNTSRIHKSWDYEGYSKVDDYAYSLKNVPIVVYYKNSGFIVLRYTGESGKPEDLDFVTISADINELVQKERARRDAIYKKVFKHGPEFTSQTWGTLTLNEDGSFSWTSFKQLVSQAIISANAKNGGTVSVKYTISKSLQNSYDGVLTFRFDGMSDEVNFFYKLESGGMRFEDASAASLEGNMFRSRGSGALILYFTVD